MNEAQIRKDEAFDLLGTIEGQTNHARGQMYQIFETYPNPNDFTLFPILLKIGKKEFHLELILAFLSAKDLVGLTQTHVQAHEAFSRSEIIQQLFKARFPKNPNCTGIHRMNQQKVKTVQTGDCTCDVCVEVGLLLRAAAHFCPLPEFVRMNNDDERLYGLVHPKCVHGLLKQLAYMEMALKGGAPILKIGTGKPGKGRGKTLYLKKPSGITFGSNGQLYVLDAGNQRVLPFSPEGKLLAKFSPNISNSTRKIAVDRSGFIYLLDTSKHCLQILNSEGKSVRFLGTPGQRGNDQKHFNCPVDLAIGSSKLYVADQGNHRIVVYDLERQWTFEKTIRVHLNNGMVLDQMVALSLVTKDDDAFFLVARSNGELTLISPTGENKMHLGRNSLTPLKDLEVLPPKEGEEQSILVAENGNISEIKVTFSFDGLKELPFLRKFQVPRNVIRDVQGFFDFKEWKGPLQGACYGRIMAVAATELHTIYLFLKK